ncbi:MAG: hypothetical protein HY300_00430 [Verrucomicrobia bacterium]|nr:hypothetical protein [Verrucomicrobiota bacterium]
MLLFLFGYAMVTTVLPNFVPDVELVVDQNHFADNGLICDSCCKVFPTARSDEMDVEFYFEIRNQGVSDLAILLPDPPTIDLFVKRDGTAIFGPMFSPGDFRLSPALIVRPGQIVRTKYEFKLPPGTHEYYFSYLVPRDAAAKDMPADRLWHGEIRTNIKRFKIHG